MLDAGELCRLRYMEQLLNGLTTTVYRNSQQIVPDLSVSSTMSCQHVSTLVFCGWSLVERMYLEIPTDMSAPLRKTGWSSKNPAKEERTDGDPFIIFPGIV